MLVCVACWNVISHICNAAIGVSHSGFCYKLLKSLWLWFVELCKAKSICGILKIEGFSLALVNITVLNEYISDS